MRCAVLLLLCVSPLVAVGYLSGQAYLPASLQLPLYLAHPDAFKWTVLIACILIGWAGNRARKARSPPAEPP